MNGALRPDFGSVAVPSYAGAIVRGPDGRLLCQLRDNKPEIICPGTWCCCPGGEMEPGETPDGAILRELREEFEIEVAGLRSLLTHVENAGKYCGVYHAFHADLATPVAEVRCNEGVRVDFFTPEQAIEFRQHPVSRIFLRTYMELAIN